MIVLKRGDRVRVTTHEFDYTPSGAKNDGYGFGVTGTIDRFRNGFDGRQAVVLLDSGYYVDWNLAWIERVTP